MNPPKDPRFQLAALLKELRGERQISQLQLADEAKVNVSVVNRAERGSDARISTWRKLFEGLGYCLIIDATELSEEAGGLLSEERDRREEKRLEALYSFKRTYY